MKRSKSAEKMIQQGRSRRPHPRQMHSQHNSRVTVTLLVRRRRKGGAGVVESFYAFKA
jgi:hypothetical protein